MSTTPAEIRNILVSALRDIAPEMDPAALDPHLGLRVQLDLDSMDFLNFVIAVHRRLGVEIPEADYPRLASLDGAMSYLAAKAAQPTGAQP